jgi:hypothetical protein
VSLGYSTNQKVAVDRLVEIDCPPLTADDGLSPQQQQEHPQPPPKIRARFMWDPPASLRSSSSSYFSSLSTYFSFLSSTPSLSSLAPPSHWYPTYWRRDDAGEDESEDDISHAFSPGAFSPTSASFYSPPQTPAVSSGPPPPPSFFTAAPATSSSSSSFHVFSPSSYRSFIPTLWKKDGGAEEGKELKPMGAAVQIPVGEEQDEFHDEEAGDDKSKGTVPVQCEHEHDHDHDHGTHGGDEAESHRSRSHTNREGATENEKVKAEHDGPCLVFHVHGGGFVSQSSQSHLSYLKQWAALTGIPILTVDYRHAHFPSASSGLCAPHSETNSLSINSLAPEHPYPTAHHQCYTAYKWVLAHYHELGIISSTLPLSGGLCLIALKLTSACGVVEPDDSKAALRVVVVGDSAGGNLVAGITLRALAEVCAARACLILARVLT